jgi:hypothetical protein
MIGHDERQQCSTVHQIPCLLGKNGKVFLFNQLHLRLKTQNCSRHNHYIKFCLFEARFLNFPPLLIAGVIISDIKNSNVILASVHLSTGFGVRSKALCLIRQEVKDEPL